MKFSANKIYYNYFSEVSKDYKYDHRRYRHFKFYKLMYFEYYRSSNKVLNKNVSIYEKFGKFLSNQNLYVFFLAICNSYTFGTSVYKGIYNLGETKNNEKVSLKCQYGPQGGEMHAHCTYRWDLPASEQWNITQQEICWSQNVSINKFAEVIMELHYFGTLTRKHYH